MTDPPGNVARHLLPFAIRNRIDEAHETIQIFTSMRNPRVLRSIAPSAVRGLVLQRGKQGDTTEIPASHAARFDWRYPHDHPEMHALYERAKEQQWNASTYLPWETSVDPANPDVPIIPEDFLDLKTANQIGILLDERDQRRLLQSFACWALSQFLHGEQGALYRIRTRLASSHRRAGSATRSRPTAAWSTASSPAVIRSWCARAPRTNGVRCLRSISRCSWSTSTRSSSLRAARGTWATRGTSGSTQCSAYTFGLTTDVDPREAKITKLKVVRANSPAVEDQTKINGGRYTAGAT